MNLFDRATQSALRELYGAVPASINGHKKAGWQAGSKEESNDMASVQQNPMMEIPLRKARGSEWVRVTPDMAQHWLTFNVANRSLVNQKVQQFVADMEAGNWNNDGSPIRFSFGKLLDGQHRLHAIALTGVTLQLLIVHGIDPESQVTMDTGRGRTPRDVLSIEGLGKWEATIFGTSVHQLISVDRGLLPSNVTRYTNREVRNYYLEHQVEIDSSLRALHELPRKPTPLPFSRALTMHVLFSRHDREMANAFFERLYVGDGLTKTSPVFHLRQRLMNDMVTSNKRSAFLECAFLIKAWNCLRGRGAWKNGTPMYMRDGEPLPEIK